ncbi:MAG: 50S ribosomal protein L25 [Candidatus Eremiobacteraeota bacterium]|nr:50S ribosomal protein L25 [Candidatus Eremiobacteraeota bacterium]
MATTELNLHIQRRDRTGTTSAHALRAAGKIPAVLYGHGSNPVHLAFDSRAFDDLLHHGGSHGVITLLLDGKKTDTAMVREVARNPVSRKVDHVDFQRVTAHEAVHAKVPIVTTGVAMGVKEFGGVMDVLVHELEIEAPIDEIPANFEINVGELGIHQHIVAGDVPLPKGFTLLTPADAIVVSVEPSKTARQVEEAQTGAVAEQEQPEVIGKPETTA